MRDSVRRSFAVALSIAAAAVVTSVSSPAWAYRPFDGTDADVAAHGEFELELGPIGYLYDVDGSAIVLPAIVLNFGIAADWELVIDARHQLGIGDLHGNPRSRVLDTDILLKHVLRRGTLQKDGDDHPTGISVATEFGPLLPELGGSHGVGFGANLIASYRWDNVTLHLNTLPELDRDHRADLFESLIVEGPFRWKARPVAEASFEKEWYSAGTVSLLLGTIVRVTDEFYLDAGWRMFDIENGSTNIGYEARLGLTWGVPLFEPAHDPNEKAPSLPPDKSRERERAEPEGEKL